MFGGSRKDALFYEAFRSQAQVAVDAASKFATILEDLSGAERVASAVAEDEKRGAAILRRTVRELHSTWITPLDRHHIHELVTAIDGVISLIGSTAMRVVVFRIREARPEATELARDLSEACLRVRQATDLLPRLSKSTSEEVMVLAGQIHELEGRADETHRRALAALFDGGTDPLTVMKWRELLDNLEQATDLCRDVALLFEAIVLENA
ncbi:MAG: DUF47 family protein [Polyangiaceae bacterium]